MDSRSHGMSSQAEAPATPDKISDSGTVDMSWEEHLTEVWAKLPYIYLISLLFCRLLTHFSRVYFHRFCLLKLLFLKSTWLFQYGFIDDFVVYFYY